MTVSTDLVISMQAEGTAGTRSANGRPGESGAPEGYHAPLASRCPRGPLTLEYKTQCRPSLANQPPLGLLESGEVIDEHSVAAHTLLDLSGGKALSPRRPSPAPSPQRVRSTAAPEINLGSQGVWIGPRAVSDRIYRFAAG